MGDLPTLRRELIGAFAIVFAGALLVALAGVVLVVPSIPPSYAQVYVAILFLADVALFAWFGALLLRRRLLRPLEGMVSDVEAISRGALATRLPQAETRELARLSAAVDQMAGRLIADQRELAENIRSLNETNRLLTEARDAMVRAERMASVGRLGAGIAHEVGNPLGAILGYLALLGRGADPGRAELVEAAEREARRIDRIIRGLLDYSRPRDAVALETDVNAVIRETTDLVRLQGHFVEIPVDSELTDDPVVARVDPYQLQQVFVNLLVNAADAMDDTADPRLTVSTLRRGVREAPAYTPARRKGDPPGIDYSHRRRLGTMQRWPEGDPPSASGEIIEVVFADNGPGLAADVVEHVFEPFVTTKEPGKGTGLGLAVCARLVELMGGAIYAGNGDSGGAVFRVLLPALPAETVAT